MTLQLIFKFKSDGSVARGIAGLRQPAKLYVAGLKSEPNSKAEG